MEFIDRIVQCSDPMTPAEVVLKFKPSENCNNSEDFRKYFDIVDKNND